MSSYRRVPSAEPSNAAAASTGAADDSRSVGSSSNSTSPQQRRQAVIRSGSAGSAGSPSRGGGGGGLQSSSHSSAGLQQQQQQQQQQSLSGPLQISSQPSSTLPQASQVPLQQHQQQNENPRRTASERFHDKIVAFVWVATACAIAWISDFWNIIFLRTEKANRTLMILAAAAFFVNAALMVYLTVYLPRCKGLDSSAWHVYCPKVVPTMVATGIACGLLLIRATWPAWGFLAPLILGVQAFGALFALHFVPLPC